MILLDLFCGAGGAAMGYYQAGFQVMGVDINPQPRYPFEFIQMDVIEFLHNPFNYAEIDIIHASPPCQAYSVTASLGSGNHPKMISEIRSILQSIKKPFVIENVPGAPLENPLMLCGSMFCLKVKRHRLFEISPTPLYFPPATCSCSGFFTHSGKGQYSSFANGATAITVAGHNYCVEDGKRAMGINWMTGKELTQSIPPAYTEWLGRKLITLLP